MIDIITIALSLAAAPPPGGDAALIAHDPAHHEPERQSWQVQLVEIITRSHTDAAEMPANEGQSPDHFLPWPRQALNPPPTPANDALGW